MNTEENFFRKNGYSYSPKGHIYQLSFSNNACKNSEFVLFKKEEDHWKVYTNQTMETLKQNSLFIGDSFYYFFGHKISQPDVRSYINSITLSRNYLLQSCYDEANPGLAEYVKQRLRDLNCKRVYESRLPLGIGVFCAHAKNEIEKAESYLIYPNNKVVSGGLLYQGLIAQQDLLSLLERIKKGEPSEINEYLMHPHNPW